MSVGQSSGSTEVLAALVVSLRTELVDASRAIVELRGELATARDRIVELEARLNKKFP